MRSALSLPFPLPSFAAQLVAANRSAAAIREREFEDRIRAMRPDQKEAERRRNALYKALTSEKKTVVQLVAETKLSENQLRDYLPALKQKYDDVRCSTPTKRTTPVLWWREQE